MGLLRFFLAVSVVIWHLGAKDKSGWLISGQIAVILFFILSGFYMAKMINEKYSVTGEGWQRRFYLSRFLRLFPPYWLVAAITLVFWLVVGTPLSTVVGGGHPMWPAAQVAVACSNLWIFGLDLISLAVNFTDADPMRLVGPAWTLAIELQFYLAAPFFVRRSLKFLLPMLAVLIALRLCLLHLPYDPWRYNFCAADWCFFSMGVVGYKISELIDPRKKKLFGAVVAVTIPVVALFCGVREYSDLDTIALWGLYSLVALGAPFLFSLTAQWSLDRRLGDMSFPLYLVHPIIFLIILRLAGQNKDIYTNFGGLYSLGWPLCALAIIAVMIGALALQYFLEAPIDKIRHRLGRVE